MINKNKSHKVFIAAAILLILAVSISWAALAPGKKAPDFKLQSLNGKQITLKQLQTDTAKKGSSKVLLIDFWATWCPPCRASIPEIQKLHNKYSKKGFSVVGISLDSEGMETVKQFAKNNEIKYPILLDSKGNTARKYGVRSIPTAFIVDKKGVIRYVHTGFYAGMEKEMEKQIAELLKK